MDYILQYILIENLCVENGLFHFSFVPLNSKELNDGRNHGALSKTN